MASGDVDGVDSNGSIYVNDGNINITITEVGMAEAFDFDNTAELNGGTVIVNGEELTEITSKGMGGGGFPGDNGGDSAVETAEAALSEEKNPHNTSLFIHNNYWA